MRTAGKAVVPRQRAHQDIEDAIDHYLSAAGEAAALGFINALERAFGHIARHPASGSSRHAHELDIPGLRFWPLKRYPYLVFYAENEKDIDVWRVLRAERDIPGWLLETQT